jgi:hypothetical protein
LRVLDFSIGRSRDLTSRKSLPVRPASVAKSVNPIVTEFVFEREVLGGRRVVVVDSVG